MISPAVPRRRRRGRSAAAAASRSGPFARGLFTAVEEAARRAGHDRVLDAWGADLELLRRG
ncbi:hypothetical protein ABTZ58_01570 [Streptomyces sp. NPDC094143]|uniref:hypothetical protein n=1 Tax=Streptomyces sp. NPDC094143 TaxID=3155310 RepID=UPI00332032AD